MTEADRSDEGAGPPARGRRLGFIGLGQMGRPIAINILKGGAALLASGRRAGPLEALRERGATIAADPADLADAEVIFLCLSDDAAVDDVLFGRSKLAARLDRRHIVVDLSTLTYGATTRIAEILGARGVRYLDAPVSGMEARAIDATLTVMCGGNREAFDTVRPYLEMIGNRILYFGPSGNGQLVKLINQLLFDINAAALAEMLPLAARMGLDAAQVGDVVNSGTGRSHASEFFIPRILKGHFSDGYAMSKAYKDLVSGAELGARLCVPLPVLAAATATYQTALLQGHGDKDKGGMVRVFEDLLGTAFRSASA